MVKARKSTRREAQHTWKVTRRNNQTVDVAADSLGVVDGELVFTTNDVPVRIIAADTYTDVELMGSAED
jgi:phage baseplate assembly protein gpV